LGKNRLSFKSNSFSGENWDLKEQNFSISPWPKLVWNSSFLEAFQAFSAEPKIPIRCLNLKGPIPSKKLKAIQYFFSLTIDFRGSGILFLIYS